MDDAPAVRQAVRGRGLHRAAAGNHRGHPQVPRLRADQGRRTRDRRPDRRPLRARDARRDRQRRPSVFIEVPGVGDVRARPDHRRVGGAAADQGDHAVPASPRRFHRPGGTDLQAVRHESDRRRARRPVQARARGVRHRLQDGRPIARQHGHRPRQPPRIEAGRAVHVERAGRRRAMCSDGGTSSSRRRQRS